MSQSINVNEPMENTENDVSSRILSLNGECLVFNKKIGEAVEGAKPGIVDLPPLLAACLPSNDTRSGNSLPLPTAAHRLDVPVSGCVVFARTRRALGLLNSFFSDPIQHSVTKTYWAIVETPPDNTPPIPESGELVHWIQTDPRKNKSVAHDEPGPGRKKALLRYRVAGAGRNYLFIEIELLTGRHHQIRAQLERIGLHVKGDLKYGARRSEKTGGIRLHARSLSFPDPAGGRRTNAIPDPSGGGRGDASGWINAIADPPLMDNLWLSFNNAAGLDKTQNIE